MVYPKIKLYICNGMETFETISKIFAAVAGIVLILTIIFMLVCMVHDEIKDWND